MISVAKRGNFLCLEQGPTDRGLGVPVLAGVMSRLVFFLFLDSPFFFSSYGCGCDLRDALAIAIPRGSRGDLAGADSE